MKKNNLNDLALSIAEKIEKGDLPKWVKPWKACHNTPRNFKTQIPYRGLNLVTLFDREQHPQYLTFLQIQEMGGRLKKGSKGNRIEYCLFGKKSEQSEEIDFLGKKFYTVFSLEDTENIEYEDLRELTENEKHTRNKKIEMVISNIFSNLVKIPLNHDGDRAFYSITNNQITMPKVANFHSIDDYYQVLFHELAHATAKNGVDREIYSKNENRLAYSKEELIAELSSFLICQELGIANNQEIDDQRIIYIKSWSEILKDKPEELKIAIKKAEEIKNYLLDTDKEDQKNVS